jgi:prophage regulatory protein
VGRQRLAGLAEVAELLGGVSRQRAAEITERKSFPEPIDTIAAGRVWDRAEVEAWIKEYRPHQRQQPED